MQTLIFAQVFQRVNIHLLEFEHHLKTNNRLRRKLKVVDFSYIQKPIDEIQYTTTQDIDVTITSDGLLLLKATYTKNNFKETKSQLKAYFLKSFYPAYNELFQTGAPFTEHILRTRPKDFFLIKLDKKPTKKQVEDMNVVLKESDIEIYHSDKIDLIYTKGESKLLTDLIPHYFYTIITEKNLQRFLDVHRYVWDNVSEIRQRKNTKFKHFNQVENKLYHYQKYAEFSKFRIMQFNKIIDTRFYLHKETLEEKNKSIYNLIEKKYKTIEENLKYLEYLFRMTETFVDKTIHLFAGKYQETHARHFQLLNVLLIINAIVALIRFVLIPFEPIGFGQMIWLLATLLLSSFLLYIFIDRLFINKQINLHLKEIKKLGDSDIFNKDL